MSGKLKVAVLEDSELLLDELIYKIKHYDLADVCVYATNSSDFLEGFDQKKTIIEALVLDIDLTGDSMNGIDIAHHLKLPVLFITGKTREYIDRIEDLKIFNEEPIEFLTKPGSDEKLIKVFQKFHRQIKTSNKSKYLELNFKDSLFKRIQQDEIILIRRKKGSVSNNKEIFLKSHSEPLEVSKIAMNKFFELGLSQDKFLKTHQSYIVNKDYLNVHQIKSGQHYYTIEFEQKDKSKTMKIDLSREFLEELKKSN